METFAEERYDAGFDGRATIDTVAEIMMEAENSISLSQVLDNNNHDQINNSNREDFKHNRPRFHTKKVSNTVLNVYSMDKISTIESLKMVWKIVFYQLMIGVIVSIIIILFLWILIKYIFNLNECNSYSKSIKSFSFKIFAIQCVNGIFYSLYIASILWIILDEFKTIISLIKRFLIILISTLLLWILFLFYGVSASQNIFAWNALCLLVIICMIFIIITRVCGYYAIYMLFPLLLSLFINYIVFHLIILTLFKLHNNTSYKIIFAFIYPIILHLLQTLTLKVIQYLQLPYTFNLFAQKCCLKINNDDNENEDTAEDDNEESNIRLEETVSPQYIFLICSLIAIISSTLQQIGYFVLIFDSNFSDIPILCILYIFFEVMARNKIWYEMYLKIRYKTKRESTMDVLSQIYYASKYPMQYIPICIIILLNIFVDDCYELNTQSNKYPVLFIMISVVLCCDLLTFLVKKCAIKCELWGVPNQNNQDITRQYKFIKLPYQSLIIILISCITLSIHVLYISSFFVF